MSFIFVEQLAADINILNFSSTHVIYYAPLSSKRDFEGPGNSLKLLHFCPKFVCMKLRFISMFITKRKNKVMSC